MKSVDFCQLLQRKCQRAGAKCTAVTWGVARWVTGGRSASRGIPLPPKARGGRGCSPAPSSRGSTGRDMTAAKTSCTRNSAVAVTLYINYPWLHLSYLLFTSGLQFYSGLSFYRVIHLLWDFGWVDLDFGCCTVCPILLGLMGTWPRWLGS